MKPHLAIAGLDQLAADGLVPLDSLLVHLSEDRVPEGESFQADWSGAALQLFVARAHLVNGEFALAADQMRWAVRICQLVQGMPLGIELAAAWVRTMSCEEIATGIAQGLDFQSAQWWKGAGRWKEDRPAPLVRGGTDS